MWQKVYLVILTVLLLVILVFVIVQPWLWKLYFGVDFPMAIQGLDWILIAMIAILSAGAALYGILVYQALRQALARELKDSVANESNATLARAFGNLAFSFYRNWRFHMEDKILLESAINANECSLNLIKQVGAKEYPELKLVMQHQIASNLCGYVAHQGLRYGIDSVKPETVARARTSGAKSFKAAAEFGKEPDWKANYAGFLNIFGTSEEKTEARTIMSEVKQRHDIPDDQYNEYLELFPDACKTLLRE